MKELLKTAAAIFLIIQSNHASAGVAVDKDVVYREVDGQRLALDVYRPSEEPDKIRPAVIYVHGGGWQSGDKKRYSLLGESLAREGFVGFSINYRLMNDQGNRWPAQIDDVVVAVRWVRAHASVYHVDPKMVAAIGDSAGGQLVSLLGTMSNEDRVATIVDIYGPVDLTEAFAGKVESGAWVDGLLKKLFEGPRSAVVAKEASPIFQVNGSSAAFLILHGSQDEVVPLEQSERMHATLQKAGAESRLVVLANEKHRFANPEVSFKNPENNVRFNEEILQFLKRHLQP